jgi:RimJ/RimL family protein N-acetyltransferase
VVELAAGGQFDRPGTEAVWLTVEGEPRGLVRLFDLEDPSAMFDIRVAMPWRGRGLGAFGVEWLTEHVFATRSCDRIEATTRQDNAAMRSVLTRCGYVKEAHYRRAWPSAEGAVLDSVGYAVLRGDWMSGSVTPVEWDE